MDAVRQLDSTLFQDGLSDDLRASEAVEKIGLWAYGEADLGWKAAEPLINYFLATRGWPADETASYRALDLAAMLPTHSEWRGPETVVNNNGLSPPVGTPSTCGAAPEQASYLIPEVRDLGGGVSNETLNKYARKAGLPVATRGQKDFRRSHADAVSLFQTMQKEAPNESERKLARIALEKLKNMPANIPA